MNPEANARRGAARKEDTCGFLPVVTRSRHGLANGDFRKAVEVFLEREGRAVGTYVSELEGPYRKDTES